MSCDELSYLLSDAYNRAMVAASPDDIRPIRRAFGRAIRALRSGDGAPAALLVVRWP